MAPVVARYQIVARLQFRTLRIALQKSHYLPVLRIRRVVGAFAELSPAH